MQHLSPILYPTPSQAIFKLIPKEEQSRLPEDENTPEKRANKLWSYFEKKDNGEGNNTHATHVHTQSAPAPHDRSLCSYRNELYVLMLERKSA